jgi:hypothetical protein
VDPPARTVSNPVDRFEVVSRLTLLHDEVIAKMNVRAQPAGFGAVVIGVAISTVLVGSIPKGGGSPQWFAIALGICALIALLVTAISWAIGWVVYHQRLALSLTITITYIILFQGMITTQSGPPNLVENVAFRLSMLAMPAPVVILTAWGYSQYFNRRFRKEMP